MILDPITLGFGVLVGKKKDLRFFNLSVAVCKIVINHFRLPGRSFFQIK